MRDGGGGVIINMSSQGGLVSVPYSPSYAAAKAGVISLTRTLPDMLRGDEHPGERHLPRLHRHAHDPQPARALQPGQRGDGPHGRGRTSPAPCSTSPSATTSTAS